MPSRVRVTFTKSIKIIYEVAADTYEECETEVLQACAKEQADGWNVRTEIIASTASAGWVFWVHHFDDDITQPGVLCITAPLAGHFTEATKQAIIEYATAAGWLEKAWNGETGSGIMSIRTSRALPQADRDAWTAFLSTVKFQSTEEREQEQAQAKARRLPDAVCRTCGYAPCACDQQ